MGNESVCLEGIAHDGNWDVFLENWHQLMDLARCHGWELSDDRLWGHFYSPIGEPEPIPPQEARRMADALEGALVPRCSHDQCRRDPGTPAALLAWGATAEGKRIVKEGITFLRKGGFFLSYKGSSWYSSRGSGFRQR